MIFADKLIELRKKSGLTQEELAEKMDVSRQSIAKWEGAQSIPDLSRILKLSELFGVSTDYLLKDDLVEAEHTAGTGEEGSLRRVSMEEAGRFLTSRRKAAMPIAIATLLCILSPVVLILLSALCENPAFGIRENVAVGIGLCSLLLSVAVAVALFITTGNKNARYAYLGSELIEPEYGVCGMVRERKEQYKPTYDTCNVIGAVLCILSVLPILIGIAFHESNAPLMAVMICLLLSIAGIGVTFFIRVGVVWASYDKLLQDGEYSKEKKREQNSIIGAVSSAYWLIVTAVYLAVSFSADGWGKTWIIFVVAGVLYPAVTALLRSLVKKGK